MSEPVVQLATVVINVIDLEVEKAFWSAVLGVGVARAYPGICWLEPQRAGDVCVALQQVEDPTGGRRRLHLDTVVPDIGAARDKIVELGGSHVEDHEIMGFHWTVMADPEGNEFCIAAS